MYVYIMYVFVCVCVCVCVCVYMYIYIYIYIYISVELVVARQLAHLEPQHILRVECAAVHNDRSWDKLAVLAHEPRLALEEGRLVSEND